MLSRTIHVKDIATSDHFIVLKPNKLEEFQAMERRGWNKDTTHIVVRINAHPGVIMSGLHCIPYDLNERGSGLPKNRTTMLFLKYVKETPFNELLDEVDLTNVVNPWEKAAKK